MYGKLPFPNIDDEDEDAAEVEKDREVTVAENFDKKLVDEVSRCGILPALTLNRLAGWEAETLKGVWRRFSSQTP